MALEAIRLLDLVAALSVGTDLGNGQPPGTAMRITRRALRVAREAGLAVDDAEVVWTGLLRFAGCVSTSVEEASFGGDDLALRSALLSTNLGDPGDLVVHLGSGRYVPPGSGPIDLAEFARRGPELAPSVLAAHCEVALSLSRRLGMDPAVLASVGAYHERWDGGGPMGARGEQIPLVSRLLAVCQGVELHGHLDAGERGALIRARAGSMYDPALAECALAFDDTAPGSPWSTLESVAAVAARTVSGAQTAPLFEALGDWADLKAPFFAGHSRSVARVAAVVARSEGEDATLLRAAAAVHDIGRVGVPNGIWERPGPLDASERQRMRSHVAVGLDVLGWIPGSAPIRRLVATHHERLNGTGYPAAFEGAALPRAAKILAAADAWVSCLQSRPHRPAMTRDEAAATLSAGAREGALDARAVAAVLDAEGIASARPALPAGLTEREADVLALVARGLTNKEVGERAAISPRTVQQHTLSIYRKIGVGTRAAATLFAAEHGLVG
ncbi:MAG: HD domain-containing protein [Myxococcales bacterium]|nr:HD domain-containing protein [Myxococcales bacterium]